MPELYYLQQHCSGYKGFWITGVWMRIWLQAGRNRARWEGYLIFKEQSDKINQKIYKYVTTILLSFFPEG